MGLSMYSALISQRGSSSTKPYEAVRQETERQVTMDQKMEKLESALDNLSTRFARLMSDFNSTQLKLKQRLTKMEKMLTREGDAVSTLSTLDLEYK
ncbi:hypothetical protein ACOMHN_061549 [Nucella lapillus]